MTETKNSHKPERRTGRISTKISAEIKEKWHNFLLSRYGTIKNVYGRELEYALEMYMMSHVSIQESPSKPLYKNTLAQLRRISDALERLPSYPFVTPMLLNNTIKHYVHTSSACTRKRYRDMVLNYIGNPVNKTLVQYNMEPFVKFIESERIKKELS